MKSLFILIPILMPFIFALLLNLIKFKSKKTRNIFIAFSIITNFILTICVLYFDINLKLEILKLNDFIDIYINVDKLGVLFSILASGLWIFTSFYSMEYMNYEKKERRFFTFFILTLGITIGIAFSGNLFTLYIFYELLTLFTFPLVIHAESKDAFISGRKYLIYSFGGATLVLLGMILLYSIHHDLSFIPRGILSGVNIENNQLMLIIYLLMFLGFGVKAAVVPFHSWLPAAMVAPTPVSSLLHAVAVVKSGVFSIVRVSYFIFGADVIKNVNGNLYASIFVGITILMGSLLALHHDNLKKRLAYSTISQLGYILLGVLMLNENALIGGLMHLVNHALIKIVLFFCAGAIYVKKHIKNISDMKGIGKEMPITMWCFAIASISLIGIPPTNGFVSKWYLALGGLNANKIMFPIILLLSAFLTATYLLPIVVIAFFPGYPGYKDEKIKNNDPNIKMLFPIVLVTGIVVILGIFPNVVINFIEKIVIELI
ncbi:proton-conducting transporter transmembrane domain-containing protein [Tepidibacter formicigenes]|jgi:multicomponent Na+:H+ antiporter subunit D|uniref:Multisubunit sodium/proton antiporter, MrpD subunit n=1 Tax=Tepidibacter formicigenes DSM 15518 TaxID=1123349 RepID=A0A1M6NXB0_9FIRM|nr:proton-conducting transporter membrane subunit [Tepidibacter formicigenes]SHK00271.1 multisubunit sodium/proton antiporter, MrpD subunit [Tepidibacter formicigenes DSM 15518]